MANANREATVFAFPVDIADEGAESAIGRIADAGMDGISLAALYHDGRDLLPHNPRHRIKFQEDGVIFFEADSSFFPRDGIQPLRAATDNDSKSFEKVVKAARNRGLSVIAWTVFLHNTSLGRRNPNAVNRNVYGDPQFTSICPANPATVAYSLGVVRALVAQGVDAINAEGLHFLPLEHGYHHERYFLRIGPIDRFLLGLCFCTHCMRAAALHGVDTIALQNAVRGRLDRVFDSSDSFDPTDDTPELVRSMWSGELGAFLKSREATVTQLAEQVHQVLRESSTNFIFNDPAGAFQQPGDAYSDESWRIGIDTYEISKVCDAVQVLAYGSSPAKIEENVRRYRQLLANDLPMRVALRPMWPDCESTENLTAKLKSVQVDGVIAADFYAYDFMRIEELDRVQSSIVAADWTSTP